MRIAVVWIAVILCAPLALGAQTIHSAALAEDYDAVLRALEAGASPNTYNLSGFAPLHSAARGGSVVIAELLLDNGADVNIIATAASRDTPLHLATINGNEAVVDLLLQRDADPNLRNAQGNTPLHEAAIFGSPSIVRTLLQGGADRTITNQENQTAADISDQRDDEEVLEELETRFESIFGAYLDVPELLGAYLAVGISVPLFLTNGTVSNIDLGLSVRVGATLNLGLWVPLGGGVGFDVPLLSGLTSAATQVTNFYVHVFPLILGFATGPALFGVYFDGGVTVVTGINGYIGAGGQIMINFSGNGGMYARGGFVAILTPATRIATPVEIGYSLWL